MFGLFVILVILRFGFEGWIGVLIASVPDLCIPFTFKLAILLNELCREKPCCLHVHRLIRVFEFCFVETVSITCLVSISTLYPPFEYATVVI